MSLTYEQFRAKTGAQKVAGQLIVGIKSDRKVVGTYKNGIFNLNEDGKKYLAGLDATQEKPVAQEKPKRGRRKKEVVESDDASAELEKLFLEDE